MPLDTWQRRTLDVAANSCVGAREGRCDGLAVRYQATRAYYGPRDDLTVFNLTGF